MTLFGIVWGIDVIVALVAVFFFVWGVQDGSVSTFNIGCGPASWRRWASSCSAAARCIATGIGWLATLLAAVPAIPALLYGLLIVAMMFSGARWN